MRQRIVPLARQRVADRKRLEGVVELARRDRLTEALAPDGPMRRPDFDPKSMNVAEHQKTKNPSRINDLGYLVSRNETSEDALGPRHMCSIITCPNPEQETWVAPSMSRAKS